MHLELSEDADSAELLGRQQVPVDAARAIDFGIGPYHFSRSDNDIHGYLFVCARVCACVCEREGEGERERVRARVPERV